MEIGEEGGEEEGAREDVLALAHERDRFDLQRVEAPQQRHQQGGAGREPRAQQDAPDEQGAEDVQEQVAEVVAERRRSPDALVDGQRQDLHRDVVRVVEAREDRPDIGWVERPQQRVVEDRDAVVGDETAIEARAIGERDRRDDQKRDQERTHGVRRVSAARLRRRVSGADTPLRTSGAHAPHSAEAFTATGTARCATAPCRGSAAAAGNGWAMPAMIRSRGGRTAIGERDVCVDGLAAAVVAHAPQRPARRGRRR